MENKSGKETILEKSRLEKSDEGMEHAEMQGLKQGFYWMSFVYAAVAVCNLIFAFTRGEQMTAFYAASAMYFCFSASAAHSKYRFTGNKGFKIGMVCAVAASVCFFLNWIVKTVWP